MTVPMNFIEERCERTKKGPLVKMMVHTLCKNNCFYCGMRRDIDCPKVKGEPEEIARSYFLRYKNGRAGGLFLSSGIVKSGDITQESINKTAEILRKKYNYKGYIHLKLMPGASASAIEHAITLANRVSINLEAPSSSSLKRIAPDKDMEKDIANVLKNIIKILSIYNDKSGKASILPSGIATQFVFSPLGEPDKDYLRISEILYKKYKLKMIYFSAFFPIPGTRFENNKPVSKLRERRIYQAGLLIRDYNFNTDDFVLNEYNNLPLDSDPKMLWALSHPEFYPVEIMNSPYEILIKVPGIGPKTAKKIIENRKIFSISSLEHLRKIGVRLKRAMSFITLKGKYYSNANLSLF